MKGVVFAVLAAAMVTVAACGNKNDNAMKNESANCIFEKGEKAAANFTGSAWVRTLVPKSDTTAYAVADVIFEPGCRNYWHTHQIRQTMIITAGKGWYQERGKEAQALRKGDVVVIPANVEHWHGATADDLLEHVVITDYQGDECVVWLGPVTDAEYGQLPPSFE